MLRKPSMLGGVMGQQHLNAVMERNGTWLIRNVLAMSVVPGPQHDRRSSRVFACRWCPFLLAVHPRQADVHTTSWWFAVGLPFEWPHRRQTGFGPRWAAGPFALGRRP